ncbi:hypothetical protein GN244_ATG06340 [Phytophthora infestans]|uniref:C1q domain-containing protein n=1 Tax=Phytophthora infestans TaxID=4787 RepID=A0A833T0P0_PHYIN|nr:hypothetical protein GN244_ATG06340 [Phytophthora infestans]
MQNVDVNGTTTFAATPSTSYRYSIQVKDDKLSVWIEDRTSKNQWYKGDLAKADYVTSANTISNASANDYARCFQDALDCDLNDVSGARRSLTSLQGDVMRLEFTVNIHVLRSMWVARYTFNLEPVSVERIDVLESKLRDQGEVLKSMVQRMQNLLHSQTPTHLQLKSTQRVANGSTLHWNKTVSDDFAVSDETGAITFCRPGIYYISAVVGCKSYDDGKKVHMMKNGKCIQASECGYMKSRFESIPLGYIERMDCNDVLSVTCTCDDMGTSSLSIVRLGN